MFPQDPGYRVHAGPLISPTCCTSQLIGIPYGGIKETVACIGGSWGVVVLKALVISFNLSFIIYEKIPSLPAESLRGINLLMF